MNECIVISDGEEETHRRSGTTINDEPTDYSSTMSCVPEFASVPSASSSNMISELESDDIPKPNMESENISMLPKIAPCNIIEITISELKKTIRKNDVVIKIDGNLNHTNINAIMSVIQKYNFKNARQIFFVRSSNPNEDININDLMCHEKLDPLSEQEKSIPHPFQKVQVFCIPYNLKAQAACNQQKTVVNQKPQRVLFGTAVPQAKHQKNQEIVSNLNVLHPNTQNIYNGLKLKPFDQICRTSQPVVETVVAGVSYDPLECALPPNNLNEFSEGKQKNSKLLHSTYNESTQQTSSKVSEHYPKKLKYRGVNWNGNTETKNNDHMNYVPQPNVLNEFSEKTQADLNLQEARTNYEHNPKKFKYRLINWNGNTETKNNDHMNYVPQPNVLNEFSEKTQADSNLQEARTNYEHNPKKFKYRRVNRNGNTETKNNDHMNYVPQPNVLNEFSEKTQADSNLQEARTNYEHNPKKFKYRLVNRNGNTETKNNDHMNYVPQPNVLNEFSEKTQADSNLQETRTNYEHNPKKFKYRFVNRNGNTETKNNDHMNYVPQPNVLNEFSEKTQADSNLQEARTNYEHNPKKFKYRLVNRNGNTETKNNDHMNYVPQPNVLNEFSEKTQADSNLQEARTNYEHNPKKFKYRRVNRNDNTETKNNDHMNYVPQPNVLNEFSEKTPADSNLQEARTNYEHNPKKFKYRRVNRNGNTETKNNDHMNYVPQPNMLNEFSEKTQTEDRTNYEPTLQSPSSLNSWSPSLLKTKYCSVIRNERKRKIMVQGKKCVKQAAKDISKMQFQLSSHYINKYQLKEARVSLSRSEVENYFKKMELRKSLSFSEQNTSSNVNQIFIDDHNFASMTHYHCDETPPNTQIYFVNKHNIITSLYMKNFPLFKRAIKTNKIKVISESTYRKYRPVQDNTLTGSLNRFETKLKTHNFCKVVSDFHRTMSDMQNPFLKSIKLDHSYSCWS